MAVVFAKGIPAEDRAAAVDRKIEEMGLRQYADRPAGGYSGGNKRKLSVAMAMIGDPQVQYNNTTYNALNAWYTAIQEHTTYLGGEQFYV